MSPAAATLYQAVVDDDIVQVRCSTKCAGDFHLDGAPHALRHRRAALSGGVWSQPDEQHGAIARRIERPGEHDGVVADGLVTRLRGAVIGIWVGDCAPIAFIGARGTIGAAHAGWRGAVRGIVGSTAALFGDEPITAVLGPCIHPCCYEFGAADLEACAARFGDAVRAVTAWGSPALDMRAVIRAALAEQHIDMLDASRCTGCNADTFYSHRVRAERGRQVMTICKRRRE